MTVKIFNPLSYSEQDIDALLNLFRNSSAESDYMATGEITTIETMKQVLHNQNLIHFFAYEDNTPVGYCQVLYKANLANFNTGAKVNALSVLPEKRGLGLGKKLLEETVATLQKNVCIRNIYLEVVKDNKIAVNLYKSIGFEKAGELKSIFSKNNIVLDIEIYSLLVNK